MIPDRTVLPASLVPTMNLVIGIFTHFMRPKHPFVVYNQQRRVPNTPGLQGELQRLGIKTYGNSTSTENGDDGLYEVISTASQEMYQFDIFSKNEEVILRNVEPIAALASTYAEQVAEANNFKLSQIPTSMTDLSRREGEGILTRFAMTFMVLRSYVFRRPIEYFDQFQKPALVTQP